MVGAVRCSKYEGVKQGKDGGEKQGQETCPNRMASQENVGPHPVSGCIATEYFQTAASAMKDSSLFFP